MNDKERIDEVKQMLADSIEAETGVEADANQMDTDVYVSGGLSEIWEWAQAYRSEIEELG